MPKYVCQKENVFSQGKIRNIGVVYSFRDGVIDENNTNWKLESVVEEERLAAIKKEESLIGSSQTRQEALVEADKLRVENAELRKESCSDKTEDLQAQIDVLNKTLESERKEAKQALSTERGKVTKLTNAAKIKGDNAPVVEG